MFQVFGFGGVKCPRCEHKNAGDPGYCANCGLTLGAPRNAALLRENRWSPDPQELAAFFGVRELSSAFARSLQVPPTARAWVLQGTEAIEVPGGQYQLEDFLARLGRLVRSERAEILVTHSAPLELELAFDDLRSADQLAVSSRFALGVRIGDVARFAQCFMTEPGALSREQLSELLAPSVREAAAEFVGARSLRDMAGNGDLRPQLDERLQGALAARMAGHGLAVVQLRTLTLRHDKVEADGRRGGSFWLVGESMHAGAEHSIPLERLYDRGQWQQIVERQQESRLRYRRVDLRQPGNVRRAELSLQDSARAQAIRAREIELYGRIVDARTRKQAIENGASDVLTELEHELSRKGGAREDEAAGWAHLRQLARIRMQTELEVAQQDALEARQLAHQRFSHQLLCQQIDNKVRQAHGIDDEARKRSELARLEQSRQAQAERALALEAEQHQAALQSLALANAAHKREAERVQEWEDQLMLDSRRELLRNDMHKDVVAGAQAEQFIQQAEALRRAGAEAGAIAQHEKLLRTIEADGIHARQAQSIELEALEQRHARRQQEQEADWQQELRRLEHARDEKFGQLAHAADMARLETARLEAIGAMSDSAKVALAAAPNAAALADFMKTQVHAGMSPEQLAALSGVVGAGGVSALDAERIAQQRLQAERAQRDAEVDKDRRHQFDLLNLQNDVNKAALASHAAAGSAAATVAARRCGSGHAALAHDKFCAVCGAALSP